MKNMILGMALLILWGCSGVPETSGETQGEAPRFKEYVMGEVYEILPDRVIQGDKEAVAVNPLTLSSTYYPSKRTREITADLSALPKLSAPDFPMLVTLYNLALEESLQNVRPSDGAFMAGEKWKGIWTRDISYSIHLAMAALFPEHSETSLRLKVNSRDMVIQDTGTGGSWPVSTDRVVWAIGAWEIYRSHGKKEWLEYSYKVLKNTALRDRQVVWDASTGLYLGESSFMDWREQSYPKWMTPVDIFESKSLGTNILHRQLLAILGDMGTELGAPAAEIRQWKSWSEGVDKAINKELWLEDKGYYSSYQYPRIMGNPLTDKTDTLGESLAVLFGVAQGPRAKRVVESTPVVHYGVPTFYPQMAHAPYYHNKGIWPFVHAYFTWAGAKTGNSTVAEFGIKGLIRAAALFLTNKENFTYDTGHYRGTEVNSDRQLWSVAGYLAAVHRVLFGMEYTSAGLSFKPLKPALFAGDLTLSGYPFHGKSLKITVKGSGNQVSSLLVDGVEKGADYVVPYKGPVPAEIIITVTGTPAGVVNMQPIDVMGPKDGNPTLELDKGQMSVAWRGVTGATEFEIYEDGRSLGRFPNSVRSTQKRSVPAKTTAYFLKTYNEKGWGANFSEYVLAGPDPLKVEAESGKYPGEGLVEDSYGFSGEGVVNLPGVLGEVLELDVLVPKAGLYALRFTYANGNGPISTDNKGAIRTLLIGGRPAGKIILPQTEDWVNWQETNSVWATLPAGSVKISLTFTAEDENMNQETNQAHVDLLTLYPF